MNRRVWATGGKWFPLIETLQVPVRPPANPEGGKNACFRFRSES